MDKFQGQQNDFILLSLVRTRFVGHLRDVRRLIVAMSRARLGLYVFCRRSLFEQCYELQPTFRLLLERPDQLALTLDEVTTFTDRHVGDTGGVHLVSGIPEMDNIVNFRLHQLYQVLCMAVSCSIFFPTSSNDLLLYCLLFRWMISVFELLSNDTKKQAGVLFSDWPLK